MALSKRVNSELTRIDRILYRTDSVAVGAFRCPRQHPLFHDSGPIENDVFVFPRARVTLYPEGGRRFTADPGLVTLYNRGQLYTRDAIDDADRCDWFAVDRDLILEVARAHDPAFDGRPFRLTHVPSTPAAYFLQRQLFERLRAAEAVATLEVEETVLRLLVLVLRAAAGRHASEDALSEDDAAAVERARITLGATYATDLSLAALARAAGASRTRLCRVFRHATGMTLHAYREGLRLRASLEPLADGHVHSGLTDLALNLGYSSHSHFTARFRRAFGVTPSKARRTLDPPSFQPGQKIRKLTGAITMTGTGSPPFSAGAKTH